MNLNVREAIDANVLDTIDGLRDEATATLAKWVSLREEIAHLDGRHGDTVRALIDAKRDRLTRSGLNRQSLVTRRMFAVPQSDNGASLGALYIRGPQIGEAA